MNENPIDKDKTTDTPHTLAYAHTVGGAVIRPEDIGRAKGLAMSAMQEQTDMQLQLIRDQIELLAQQVKRIEHRKEVSQLIYTAEMGFDPLIGHEYHLYKRKNGNLVLSMISPFSWGRSLPFEKHLSKVKLLSDRTWEIFDDNLAKE